MFDGIEVPNSYYFFSCGISKTMSKTQYLTIKNLEMINTQHFNLKVVSMNHTSNIGCPGHITLVNHQIASFFKVEEISYPDLNA